MFSYAFCTDLSILPRCFNCFNTLSTAPVRPAVNATSCTPLAYGSGRWEYRPRTNATALVHPEDAVEMAGFGGCASSREFYWHLGSDNGEQWDRFPVVGSWRWGWGEEGGCGEGGEYGLRSLYEEKHKRELVRELVENGGWLLIGDSITEGHFFSLSCLLYPHVVATPDYVKNPYFDRAWPQHMYLNPESPVAELVEFPEGFNISETPLVTFRRVDLLLSTEELEELHRRSYGNSSLFSDEAVWTLSPSTYISDLFLLPLPHANYATLVVSTAGHWTTSMFSAYATDSDSDSGGIHALIAFFREAMLFWSDSTQSLLSHDPTGGVLLPTGARAKRHVLVRAYLPGHEDCHDHRRPWDEIQPMKWGWYNWAHIAEFNRVFEDVVADQAYPDIHYLGIDRPARLRPDAHATGDCLHIIAGAGVLEGWSEYIWHYSTWFLRGGEVQGEGGI
ncbi:hypothetical protein F5876DRAFT_90643 [Lentinula aff. lateritia]|uniref:Uncharacterized protein n=1 Tax=Lentinula aff. lateritia TaxID=2804960 RepID=A0ACC1TRJ5_9AGAR|nr:hypothetical protein F5876DRAFT_90643 [Lentinula aff. lateritia]